jgi:pilus assembly protein FimV
VTRTLLIALAVAALGASSAAAATGGASAPATSDATPTTPTTTYVPPAAVTTPGAATTPGATTTPGAATTPGTATAPTVSTPATTAPAGTSPQTTGSVKGQRATSKGGLSGAAIAIITLAALLVLACIAWALARRRAFEPHWLLSLRHAMAEAGFRASATWSEFADWVRLGR